MSKSRGNALDPVEAVGQYGADALRFTLASMATPGSDMKLSADRLAGYRTFCNKLQPIICHNSGNLEYYLFFGVQPCHLQVYPN